MCAAAKLWQLQECGLSELLLFWLCTCAFACNALELGGDCTA